MPQPPRDASPSLKRILKNVYEQKRDAGYSKTRASKLAWGAVKRAGFHQTPSGRWTR